MIDRNKIETYIKRIHDHLNALSELQNDSDLFEDATLLDERFKKERDKIQEDLHEIRTHFMQETLKKDLTLR